MPSASQTTVERRYYTVREFAAITHQAEYTVRRKIREGLIPSVRQRYTGSSRHLIPVDAAEAHFRRLEGRGR